MKYTAGSLSALVILRITIGWHFLYEGLVKATDPSWSSRSYLMDSGGFLKGFFERIAENNTALTIADSLNAWGLTLIGIALVVGIFTRYAAYAGIVLLGLYYLSHPAFPGITYLFPVDGSYFIINKTLIELAALWVIISFPTSDIIGLERLFKKNAIKTIGK
ncbi:MAG: DoxX family membrane protein [Bacteroidales bacterium]